MAYQPLEVINAKSIIKQIINSISYNSVSISTEFNCQKTFLFQAIQFFQIFLIQLIQFRISTDFVYTQLNVKTVLY